MRKVTVIGKGSLFTLQFWIIFIAPKLHCSLFGFKCIFFLFLTPPPSFTSTSLLYIISNSFNRYTAVLNKMRKHFDVFISSCPAGRAVEPLPLWRLCALHPSTLPHPLDQRERLLELRALLLQVPGPCHQHQEPTAGKHEGSLQHKHGEVWGKKQSLTPLAVIITVAQFDLKHW